MLPSLCETRRHKSNFTAEGRRRSSAQSACAVMAQAGAGGRRQRRRWAQAAAQGGAERRRQVQAAAQAGAGALHGFTISHKKTINS